MTLVATATFLWVWWLRADFQQSLAMAALSIACSYALSLVASIAIFYGLALDTKQNILFQSSAHFETLQNTTDVVLDKTGTISSGHSTVTKLHWWQAAYPELALTLTSHSNRQISKIFQQHLASKSLQLILLNNWMEMADSVLRTVWENQLVSGGNHRWMEKNGVSFTSNEQKELEQWKEQRGFLFILAVE